VSGEFLMGRTIDLIRRDIRVRASSGNVSNISVAFIPNSSFTNMSHTTQNTLYTSNRGGQRTIDRNSHAFVHAHRIIATTPGLGYPSNQGIQDMAMRDAQAFRYGRRGQELSANDTIWVGAMIADRSLMRRQEQPEVRRDKVLERLIDIGVYDRGERLDLNNNPSEERSFRYAAVLTNLLWDRVHDLESEVAFALVLCFHITEAFA
jgi:hypothetical protein